MPSPAEFLQTVKLPVMSEVAHLLIRTLNEPEASVQRVRDVIAKDPALTTALVRMANSALFGLSRSVSSLDHAISVVGMAQIRARALSICLTDVFPISNGLDRAEFWRSSMACAGYAQWLAGKSGIDQQVAWLTGMMLRLGELLIGQRDAGLLEQFSRQPRAPGDRWLRQRELLGFDEGQVTGEMARRWDFPDQIVAALKGCADPMSAQPFRALAALIHLAGLLADSPVVEAHNAVELPRALLAVLLIDGDRTLDDIPPAQAFTELAVS